jgi:hypothetical protein
MLYGAPFLPPHRQLAGSRVPDLVTTGVSFAAKKRNTVLDRMFYDVGALTAKEMHHLASANADAAIIAVYPKGNKGDISLQRYENLEKFFDSPGRNITKFSIAGVGSSDVGAAALARTLSDFTGEPVGAIVAGYGLPDLFSESIGGWFCFGAANRMMDAYHRAMLSKGERKARLERSLTKTDSAPSNSGLAHRTEPWPGFSPDTLILVRLLHDSARDIDTILGHSKGCLSIASAFEALILLNKSPDMARAKRVRVITTGAVVEFPPGFNNVKQYLGTLDWFGGMNSAAGEDFVPVPNAWHHVNTSFPFHLNMQDVLKQAL